MSEEWLSVADIRAAQARSSEEGLPDNHVVTIVERTLTVDIPELIQNNIKTDTVTLELDSEWDGISPVIIFECSDADYQVQYEGAATHIPQAVMKNTGSVGCSVCGYDDTGEVRLVTKAAPSTFSVVASGSFIGEISEDDVSLLGQILAAADAANAAANKVENASFTATATTLEPGESATAQITGDDLKMTVAFGIPKGETGEPGVAATIAVGTVTTGEPGTDAAVSNSGTAQAAVLDFTIPKGDAPVRGVDYWTAEDVEQVVADAKAQAVAELAEIGNVPKRTVSDLVAHGEDAYAQKPIEVRVKGRTVKNLWLAINGTRNGVTISTDETGLITITGTPTGPVIIYTEPMQTIKPNTSYSYALTKIISNDMNDASFALNGGGSNNRHFGIDTNGTFVSPNIGNDAVFRCQFYIGSISSLIGQPFNWSGRVMLVEGTEVPDCFTPPASITSVQTGNLVTAGKNLLGSSTFSGGAPGEGFLNFSLPAGTYTLSCYNAEDWWTDSSNGSVWYIHDSNLNFIMPVNMDSPSVGSRSHGVFTLLYSSDFTLHTYKAGINEMATNLQLELGSTATAYEPPNVTTTPLPEVELRGLPNGTCDELVIKADGTCEVERNTGIWTFTGSENWAQDPAIGGIEIPYFGCTFSGTSENVPRINWGGCNDRLPVENPYTYSGDCFYIFANGSGYIARIRKSGCNDVASIKEWLASNNVHAVYGAVDTTEPQSSVTLPVLPAPTFNAYSDADIPSDTSVNYARDINIALSNLEAVQTALLGGEE